VVELDGAMIGIVTLDRRDAGRPGHVRPEGGEVELGYLILPQAWGCGYATEACTAALDWFARAHPGEPVVLTTRTANEGSMRVTDGSPRSSGSRSTAPSSGSARGPRSRRAAEAAAALAGADVRTWA
jgi:hypothetical protein